METLAGTYKKTRTIYASAVTKQNKKYEIFRYRVFKRIYYKLRKKQSLNWKIVEDSEISSQFLSVMPESYSVSTAIEILFCQEAAHISLEFVKSKFLMEETGKKKLSHVVVRPLYRKR